MVLEEAGRSDQPARTADVQDLLDKARAGDRSAFDALYDLAYPGVICSAERLMRAQPAYHTLEPGGLANEGYLKLLRSAEWNWNGFGHFVAVAHCAMRHCLIDHANKKGRIKRGGDKQRRRLTGICLSFEDRSVDILTLHELLERFTEADPEAAAVIMLKFYSGFGMREIATVVGRSLRSVERDWRAGRAWLLAELSR